MFSIESDDCLKTGATSTKVKPNVDQTIQTEVVIIGNGPSAITLSLMLSGHWPYYNGNNRDWHNGHSHPLAWLHDRMVKNCSKQSTSSSTKFLSLIECDLMQLSQGLSGRQVASPIALLMDHLQHPNADHSAEQCGPSLLDWTQRNERRIEHVVVGSAPAPGGIWHSIAKSCSETSNNTHSQPEMLTLSRRSLMQLPMLDITVKSNDLKAPNDQPVNQSMMDVRLPYGLVAEYYKNYVKHFGLNKYFHNQCRVVLVDYDTSGRFIVDAIQCRKSSKQQSRTVERIRFISNRVVLAKGTSTSPKMLNIPGERLSFVYHSINKLDLIIKYIIHHQPFRCNLRLLRHLPSTNHYQIDPILIVGSGLSAADAMIVLSGRCGRRYPVRIVHVFRKSIRDRKLIFNQLLSSNDENCKTYPEYHQVFKQMKYSVRTGQCLECFAQHGDHKSSQCSSNGSFMFEHYQAYEQCILSGLTRSSSSTDSGGQAILEFLPSTSINNCCRCNRPIHHQTTIRISIALILIGSKPQLDFLSKTIQQKLLMNSESGLDLRHNPIQIDPSSYECVNVPGLYAIGPLVGDNFVRYLQGGALAVANHIWNNRKQD